MAIEQFFFAGSGNKSPAVLFGEAQTTGQSLTVISGFPKGHSVYALAVSPNGLHVAVATKAGLIRIHDLNHYRAQQNSPVTFEVYHNAQVVSLAFLTDDYLASGGLDGLIKVWSIKQKKQRTEFQAHRGGVFALCSLGTLVLTSIGADGTLRMWSMNTLTKMHENGPFPLPGIAGLISLVNNPFSGLLLHPTRTGELYSYNLRCEEFTLHPVSAHQGDFCAVAVGYDKRGQDGLIATGGLEDNKIKIWTPDLKECLFENANATGIASLCWCGDDELLVVSVDGTAQRWHVQNGLKPGLKYKENDIRSCTGLPIQLVVRHKKREELEWLKQQIAKAKAVMKPDDSVAKKEFFDVLDELDAKGFTIETNMLSAAHAKIHNKPLIELRTRLWLYETLQLAKSKALIPELYDLSNVLMRLDEPKDAKRFLDELITNHTNYRDAKERIHQVQSHPLFSVDTRNIIHADLASKNRLNVELEKCNLLQKKFPWKALLQSNPPLPVKTQPALDECWNRIQEIAKLKSVDIDAEMSGIKRFTLYQNKQIREVEWMYLVSNQKDLPLGCGVEQRLFHAGSQWTVYYIFDAERLQLSKSLSVKEFNQRIRDAWSRLHTNPEVKHWFDSIHSMAMSAVQKQAQVTMAQVDDDF